MKKGRGKVKKAERNENGRHEPWNILIVLNSLHHTMKKSQLHENVSGGFNFNGQMMKYGCIVLTFH